MVIMAINDHQMVLTAHEMLLTHINDEGLLVFTSLLQSVAQQAWPGDVQILFPQIADRGCCWGSYFQHGKCCA